MIIGILAVSAAYSCVNIAPCNASNNSLNNQTYIKTINTISSMVAGACCGILYQPINLSKI